MRSPGHLMILASAGSGKTYALTTRFLRLLAAGALPERIVALTFTRKAAGEFFDEILNRLAGAAADAEQAARLAKEIGQPVWGAADFQGLLRQMIDAMPRLNLGTLDGFFAQMVQAFPLELGLGGDFALLEQAEAQRERQRVLGLLFNAGAAKTDARQDFIEAFKRATYGLEEKALQRRLDSFLKDHSETYLQAPDAELWGNAARIWPAGALWFEGTASLPEAVEACREALPWDDFNDKQRGVLEAFLHGMLEWQAGSPLPGPATTPVKNILAGWTALAAGTGEIPVGGKRFSFAPAAGRALAGVVRAIMAAELTRKLEITRGIHAVVRLYEERYDREVRRAGRLTFADVQRLLQPVAGDPNAEHRRQLLDWRLDARFDHWLLDEFQDTSREQWQILRNLIDEVVQDPEGARSFFYVGDVKQAIYRWRGGDARLFREIFDHYNGTGEAAIAEQHLAKSWRSAAPIIEMVNAVCGDAGGLDEIVPPAVTARWLDAWQDHATARPELSGYAALHYAADEAERWAETRRILDSIGAAERGLTVAVLVQTNQTGAELAEYLRAEGGMLAVAESDLQIAFDNPLTSALLALVRWAVHPGDSFARESVMMSPIGAHLGEDRIGSAQVLREIHEHGFSGFLARWIQRLKADLEAGDAFSRLRGRQLVDAARIFDASGSRDGDEFLAWIASYTLREAEAPGVVRVMTVHKAKGLGFDVVVLPDLQGQSVAQRRDGLGVHRDARHEIDWVLDLPKKAMAEVDPVLGELWADDVAEEGYEALCTLYVALTRAKRALHVVIEPVGRSRSRNFPKLIETALGEAWTRGDPQWFESESETAAKAEGKKDEGAPIAADRRIPRRVAVTGSGGKAVRLPARQFFAVPGKGGADRGQAIHRLLAQVSWLEEVAVDALRASLKQREPQQDWVESAMRTVTAPGLREIFSRADHGEVELWRERPFEIILGGKWVTGVFDRVLIRRGADGQICSAVVVDFKTDAVDTGQNLNRAVDRHRPQLETYQQAVARLTQLPLEHIDKQLVFTEIAQVVRVE
jgi:ATP-dependent helicase/nuclease subunit A